MRFRTHLISSLAVGLALYPRRPGRFAALVAGGTLIDLDHLLLYGLRTGDWSVVGALRYDRYRNRGAQAGDARPRYGPLRSWLHEPLLMLPACWAAARGPAALWPLALGLGLHLLLDYATWPARFGELLRAGGACRRCRRSGGRLFIMRVGRRRKPAYRALCRPCALAASLELPPGPTPPARARRRLMT